MRLGQAWELGEAPTSHIRQSSHSGHNGACIVLKTRILRNVIKVRKIIIGLLICCFQTWLIAAVGIQFYYYAHLPKEPDAKTGQVYRIAVNHGSLRYGSEREISIVRAVDKLQPLAISLFVIAVLIGLKYGYFKTRDDSHNRSPWK